MRWPAGALADGDLAGQPAARHGRQRRDGADLGRGHGPGAGRCMSLAVLYRCTHAEVASSRSAKADSGPAGKGEPSRMHSVLIRLAVQARHTAHRDVRDRAARSAPAPAARGSTAGPERCLVGRWDSINYRDGEVARRPAGPIWYAHKPCQGRRCSQPADRFQLSS